MEAAHSFKYRKKLAQNRAWRVAVAEIGLVNNLFDIILRLLMASEVVFRVSVVEVCLKLSQLFQGSKERIWSVNCPRCPKKSLGLISIKTFLHSRSYPLKRSGHLSCYAAIYMVISTMTLIVSTGCYNSGPICDENHINTDFNFEDDNRFKNVNYYVAWTQF